jgi:uncharacterized repeat protein (TIGR03943 family)
MPRIEKRLRKWPFGWALFFLTAFAIIEFGNCFPITTTTPQNTWQPAQQTSGMCPLRTKASLVPATPALQNSGQIQLVATIPKKNIEKQSEKNTRKPGAMKVVSGAILEEKKTIPTQISPLITPKEKPVEISPKLERVHAVINGDGSVEMQKEELDVIHYETAGFLELNDDIYDRLDFYEGKKAEVAGYVYRRSDFQPNQFVVARGYIWCCLACGAVPVGPLCEWDRATELANNAWVKVEGTITREHFKDEYYEETGDIPIIQVAKVERIPKLKNIYIYARNQENSFHPNNKIK